MGCGGSKTEVVEVDKKQEIKASSPEEEKPIKRVSFDANAQAANPERRSSADPDSIGVSFDSTAESDDGSTADSAATEPARPTPALFGRSATAPSSKGGAVRPGGLILPPSPNPSKGPVSAAPRVGHQRGATMAPDEMARRRSDPQGDVSSPALGKVVLRKGVAARGDTARLSRSRSKKGSIITSDGASSQWVTFQPASTGLTAASRELAKERLRAALNAHFMFRTCTPYQFEQVSKAMRHRIVRAGQVLTLQGEAAVHFYVCTQGGFDITVQKAGSSAGDTTRKGVLVAQVGPAGSFGSGALLRDDGEVKCTSTAAVDSEVFALAREAFQRIMQSPPPKGSEALEALSSFAPLSHLPRAIIEPMANKAERIELSSGEALPISVSEAGDNFVILIASGSLTLKASYAAVAAAAASATEKEAPPAPPPPPPRSPKKSDDSPEPPPRRSRGGSDSPEPPPRRSRKESPSPLSLPPADENAMPPPPPPRKSYAAMDTAPQTTPGGTKLLARFVPPTDGSSTTLKTGCAVACGLPGEEALLASLLPSDSSDLRLLNGDPSKWALASSSSSSDTPTVIYRLPLRSCCAAILTSPTLLQASSSFSIRALLLSMPLFRDVDAKELDALSFAFSLHSHPNGSTIISEGQPASKLHFLLQGGAQLRKAPPLLGIIGNLLERASSSFSRKDGTSPSSPNRNSGRKSGGSGGDGSGTTTTDIIIGECYPGDVLGVRSILSHTAGGGGGNGNGNSGVEEREPASAVATSDSLTIAIDRSVASRLIPSNIVKIIASRPDALTLKEAAKELGVPDKFDVKSVIARGGFGTVALAVRSDPDANSGQGLTEKYAVKRIRKALIDAPQLRKQTLKERDALAAVIHPCVCRLYATYKTAINLYLVLELCDGPELFAVLQRDGGMPERSVRIYASCVVSALATLHDRGWIYRDLKTENLVFSSNGLLKLVDLGLARRLPYGSRCYTVCGSCEYMAPEVVTQMSGYEYSADWWSLGCLLYEMRYTHTPWVLDEDGQVDNSLSENAIAKIVSDDSIPLKYPPDGKQPSSRLDSLLNGLLTRMPLARLGGRSAGWYEIRDHPFFSLPVESGTDEGGGGGVPPVNAAPIDWAVVEAGDLSMPAPPQKDEKKGDDNGNGEGKEDEEDEDEEDEEDGGNEEAMDPLTAQLLAYMKQRNSAEEAASSSKEGEAKEEAPAAAEAPSAADKEEEDKVPDLSPRDSAASAPRHGWGWASTSSELGRADSMFSMGGDIEAVNAASVDGFWDGPVWEAEGDAWDADF